MARKGSQYTDDQLAEMYRRYASLKGWSTRADVVLDKVQTWRNMSTGPVGLAIDFHETGKDNCKHIGRNAENAGLARKFGCLTVLALVVSSGIAIAGVSWLFGQSVVQVLSSLP